MTEEEMAAICGEAHKAGVIVAAHAESGKGVKDALRAGVDTIGHGSEMDAAMIELFKDNPLDDFRAFTSRRMVIARGTIIDSPAVERFNDLDAHMDSF